MKALIFYTIAIFSITWVGCSKEAEYTSTNDMGIKFLLIDNCEFRGSDYGIIYVLDRENRVIQQELLSAEIILRTKEHILKEVPNKADALLLFYGDPAIPLSKQEFKTAEKIVKEMDGFLSRGVSMSASIQIPRVQSDIDFRVILPLVSFGVE